MLLVLNLFVHSIKVDHYITIQHCCFIAIVVCFIGTTESTTGSFSTASITGIIVGSLLFGMICLFGVCCGIYFCARAKKPCFKSKSLEDSESSVKLNYSAVNNSDGTCTDSEQEEKFDHSHYQPPTPLLKNDEAD